MSKVSRVVKAYSRAFDKERKAINPPGTHAHLLVRNGQTTTFVSIQNLLVGWKNRFSDFRVQTALEIATEDSQVITAIKKCSDFEIDGHIYQVDDRDKMPPDVDHPFWRLFGTKTGEMYS